MFPINEKPAFFSHFASQFFHDKIRRDVACPTRPTSCSDRNGGCQHICVRDNQRSFHCECKTGYTLHNDGFHCKRSANCGHVRVDVVFVLDTSNSVSHESFRDELGIVVHFVRFIQKVSDSF